MRKRVTFLGTGKSGLGHLRRMASVAKSMSESSGATELNLITNEKPAGLSPDDLSAFSKIWIRERHDMVECLVSERCDLAVLDTLKLPGFEQFPGRSALILRETPEANLEGFRRAGSRPWDMLLVPNPKAEWAPKVSLDFARTTFHSGWILRETGIRGESPSSGIVVATGGGGTAETRRALYPVLNSIIMHTRRHVACPFNVRQSLGPRAQGEVLTEADEAFDPGAALNDVFRRADLVISTAGYNSVLELASTDTPTLLAAIPRSLDDQMARVRRWGPRLGFGLEPGREDDAVSWLADQITTPRRRPAVDLGLDGADRAAAALLRLLCPDS